MFVQMKTTPRGRGADTMRYIIDGGSMEKRWDVCTNVGGPVGRMGGRCRQRKPITWWWAREAKTETWCDFWVRGVGNRRVGTKTMGGVGGGGRGDGITVLGRKRALNAGGNTVKLLPDRGALGNLQGRKKRRVLPDTEALKNKKGRWPGEGRRREGGKCWAPIFKVRVV